MISPPVGRREGRQNSPDLRLTMTAATELFVEYDLFVLGFLRRGGYIGEGWASGASQGRHTLAGRGPTLGRALVWHGAVGAPPHVPSRLRDLLDLLFMAEKISSDSEDISRVGLDRKSVV